METRLPSIFKTTNLTKFTKTILESSFEVMQVISKRNTLKWPLYYLRAVEFWATFGIQIDINFATFSGKFQNYTF